jgi:hypothetical protein
VCSSVGWLIVSTSPHAKKILSRSGVDILLPTLLPALLPTLLAAAALLPPALPPALRHPPPTPPPELQWLLNPSLHLPQGRHGMGAATAARTPSPSISKNHFTSKLSPVVTVRPTFIWIYVLPSLNV